MTRRNNIIWCGGGDSTVCKGVGEHRSNTFTSTRSNACFLVGIISIIYPISVVSTLFSLILAQNTNIFIFLHQNQVKFNQIRLIYTKLTRNTKRLSLIECIGFGLGQLCLTQSGIFLTHRAPTHQTDRFALSTKTRMILNTKQDNT